MMDLKVSIIGLGVVGTAIYRCLLNKKIGIKTFDIVKESNTFQECLKSDIIFICLPTTFCVQKNEYDKTSIYNTLAKLVDNNYGGIILIKSTLEPMTTDLLSKEYKLKLIHNPEFLSSKTAYEDFENQPKIILGVTSNIEKSDIETIIDFYNQYFPESEISICSSTESESMKIFSNCFYSVKIQFFNELYILCQKMDINFETVKLLMLSNNWINPMHTNVPGPDGLLSYGGSCFPKDNLALIEFMKKLGTPCSVLESAKKERDLFR